jgi:hypothetical protein
MILIIVDLPAPFWPTSAMISAGITSSEASDKAGTPPKLLVIAVMDKRGEVI